MKADDIEVPSDAAEWPEIWEFALTYNAYKRHGGFDVVAEIGDAALRQWEVAGLLPDDLGTARAALFFEQRRYHHFGEAPSGESAIYVRSLLDRIRSLSGGRVAGPQDPGP